LKSLLAAIRRYIGPDHQDQKGMTDIGALQPMADDAAMGEDAPIAVVAQSEARGV
jgi:hypothetical protein